MSYIGRNPKVKSLVSEGDTFANLDAEARKEGRIVYATDTKKYYYDDGTQLVEMSTAAGSAENFSYELVSGTVIIPSGQQMSVFDSIDITGTLLVEGSLILEA